MWDQHQITYSLGPVQKCTKAIQCSVIASALNAVECIFAYVTARVHQMIVQQWHAATTTRHSYTLTYQFLTDLQMFGVASRYSVWTASVTGNGRGNPNIFGRASHTSGWTPLSKFLNPPLECLHVHFGGGVWSESTKILPLRWMQDTNSPNLH